MIKMKPEEYIRVRLGNVAFDINERVDNPSQSGYELFVGLEHLSSGDFTIRNWGRTNDVTSSMKLFKKGDVLFGRRNTYLRRASMADFDGVCSGDAYVLRSNPDYLVDGFLPLILNTSDLWDHANAHSAGGMSKRAKWRDLESYSFCLPPKNEQHRIAEILWAAEDVIVKNEQFMAEAEHYKQLMMYEMFHKGIGHTEFKKIKKYGLIPFDWVIEKLGDVADIERGKFTHRPRNDPDFYGGNIPFIQTGDVITPDGVIRKYTQTLNDKGLKVSKLFPKGTMVMTIAANIGNIGILDFDSAFPDSIVAINPRPKIDKAFLKYFLEMQQAEIDRKSIKGTQKNINVEFLSPWPVVVPILEEQKQIASVLTSIDNTISSARITIEFTKTLKIKLINTLLSRAEGDEINGSFI